MGKTKKELAQNPNVVAKQSVHKIKSDIVKKNKNPKFKSTPGGKTASINNSNMQKKNKLPQKTTNTEDNQNLLQNNKKELKGEQYSLKGKKNVSKNKSQNKSVNKEMKKKELEVDNSESLDYEECEGSDKLEKSLANKSEEDNEDSKKEDKDNDSWEDEEDVDGEKSKNKNNDDRDYDSENEDEDDNCEDDYFEEGTDSKDEDDDDDVTSRNDMDMSVIAEGLERESRRETCFLFPDEVVNRTIIKIGPLSKTINEEEIKTKFEAFGSIKNIHLRKEEEIKNKFDVKCSAYILQVCALIEYNCPISARRAFSMHRKLFGGNIIDVQYMDRPIFPTIFDCSKCVRLNNLMFGIDNNSIYKIFSKCGEIEYVNISRAELAAFPSGSSSFGYIAFVTKDAVNKALKLNGTIILNRPVEVHAIYPKKVKKEKAKKIKKVSVKDTENLQHKGNNIPLLKII